VKMAHTASMKRPAEGDLCPVRACDGILEPKPVENCSCHINPPCPACEGQVLWCPECTWEWPEEAQ
jgi:hypothetical protein